MAKHGLKNLVEKIKLGSFLTTGSNGSTEVNEQLTLASRLRLSFEELGPTFVKFGQLLATRPDIIPHDIIDEMSLLHDKVQTVDFKTITDIITEELGEDWQKHFNYISDKPLGSASIAQVHAAELKNGTKIVLKVQRPGIVNKINDDLNVLYFLAELIEKHIPEVRPFNPVGMVDEYFNTLALETNFLVEANNIRRFKNNFNQETDVVIPEVFFDLTTERVLTMQAIEGLALSKVKSNPNSSDLLGSDPDTIIKLGLKTYLKMVFVDGFFHGDLHPGNFFVLPNNKIGLIDFGVVGRLNRKTQMAIVNMLVALSKEDYSRLAFEYVDMAPFSEKVNVDLFAKELQSIIAPYYGLSLKNTNIGKILLSSSNVAANHGLSVPTELMLFFKSIISIESLGNIIAKDFDFLSFTLTQVNFIAKDFFQPSKISQEADLIFRESKSLLTHLPRQLNFLFRKMNSPNYHSKVVVPELTEFRKTFYSSFKLLFLGLVIASLLICSTLLYSTANTWLLFGFPGLSLIGYLMAAGLGFVAFIESFKG